MKLNANYLHDRRMLHRTGLAVERHTLRSYHATWPVLAWACGLALAIALIAGCNGDEAFAEVTDEQGVKCIIGEAANQGYDGLMAVADALQNRGTTKGVYGCTSARAGKEPAWVWKMAKRAWQEAKTSNPAHGADHWEAVGLYGEPYWAKSMIKTVKIKDHTFYRAKL